MSSHKIVLTGDRSTSPIAPIQEQAYTYRRGASIQCEVTGTVTYSVQWSNSDLNEWVDHSTIAGATADASGAFEHPVEKVRVNATAGTGSVKVYIVGSYN